MLQGICPICRFNQPGIIGGTPNELYDVNCKLCGFFQIQHDAESFIMTLDEEKRRAIADYLITSMDDMRVMSIAKCESIIERFRRPPISECAENLFIQIAKIYPSPGTHFDPINPISYSFCKASLAMSVQELHYLFYFLVKIELLDMGAGNYRITPQGWVHLASKKTAQNSQFGFVAMWFDAEMSDAYDNGLLPAIRDAGYKAYRVDREHFHNKIDDEIMANIRRSRFIVADFTCGLSKDKYDYIIRGGVYFEAGFALGLGIPVIWCVKDTALASLHFDTRQFLHIVWTDAIDLRKKLSNRILALIGQGTVA